MRGDLWENCEKKVLQWIAVYSDVQLSIRCLTGSTSPPPVTRRIWPFPTGLGNSCRWKIWICPLGWFLFYCTVALVELYPAVVKCVSNVIVVAVSRPGSSVSLSEKENSYTSIVPFIGSPDKSASKVSDERRRGALSTIDVNSPIKVNCLLPWDLLPASFFTNSLVCYAVKFCETCSPCGLWNGHFSPSQHWRCWLSRQWLFPWRFQIFQVMEHVLVDSLESLTNSSLLYVWWRYPEPLLHRRSLSDRNSSPASIRSYCSSLSAGMYLSISSKCQQNHELVFIIPCLLTSGGTQKYDGAAKLDFSFMSSGEDEGIPEELFEVCWFQSIAIILELNNH